MGLLENQIETALVLQRSRAVLVSSIKQMINKYATTSEKRVELYDDLLSFLETAIKFGEVQYLHHKSLKDG